MSPNLWYDLLDWLTEQYLTSSTNMNNTSLFRVCNWKLSAHWLMTPASGQLSIDVYTSRSHLLIQLFVLNVMMSYCNMPVLISFISLRPSSLEVDSGSLMMSPSHILHLAWVLHILTLPAYWDLKKDLVDRVSEAIPAVARCVHWCTWFIGCVMLCVELPGPVKPKTSQSLVCPLSILHLLS